MKPSNSPQVDEYIANFPEPVQEILEKIRETIRQAVPEATETISYGIPTFKHHGNLVHYAAYKNHIGFYPSSSGVEQFKAKLNAYKLSRGTIQFPLDKPIPYDLIMEIVAFRVQENEDKAKHK